MRGCGAWIEAIERTDNGNLGGSQAAPQTPCLA